MKIFPKDQKAQIQLEPKTFKEAMCSKNKNDWLIAINNELESQSKNQTWVLIDKNTLPKNTPILKSGWVFKYKINHTIKVLVVIAPNGVITWVSNSYPGSTSDKAIVEHCDILKEFQSGDLILADKGFLGFCWKI